MGEPGNPALAAFLASFDREREWSQLLVRKGAEGFELRHAEDRDEGVLRNISLDALRKVALFTATGQFRPLKSAPDLQRGWRLVCRDEQELWRAIHELYPGSLADWHAVQAGAASPTHYREFTNRQSGMYRITQLLSDEQAAQVISACCRPEFCLKQRFWTVEGLSADTPKQKSAIPCLEPCAILLELARKAARIEQEPKVAQNLPATDWDTLLSAVQLAMQRPTDIRTGDIASPMNPRRLQLLLEKLSGTVNAESNSTAEES
jgi:hypothetical protein